MKRVTVLFFAFISSAAAVPAVVWSNKEQSGSVIHSSDDVKAQKLLGDLLSETSDSAMPGVVFLLGRSKDGSESLSNLASQGVLPRVASKYDDARSIHHHVSGIDASNSMVRAAARTNSGHRVLEVDLNEFSSKLTLLGAAEEVEVSSSGTVSTTASKSAGKRARALANANFLVVKVDANADPAEIDNAVVSAIEHDSVDNVVLTAVRSTDEVKMEREMANRRRLQIMQKAAFRILPSRSRRLEDEGEGEEEGQNENQNNQGDEDMSGVYYVYMTPNILAGLLFFLLFALVTCLGVSCMNEITGQDVYVKKMPTIGREA